MCPVVVAVMNGLNDGHPVADVTCTFGGRGVVGSYLAG